MKQKLQVELQAPCDVVLAGALHFLVLNTRLPMVGRQLHGHAGTQKMSGDGMRGIDGRTR